MNQFTGESLVCARDTLIVGGACLPASARDGRLWAADRARRRRQPPTSAQAPEVLVGRPVVQTVTDYEDFTGHTEAVMSVEIRARVSGYLVEGLKDGGPNKEGTEVKKGELLFEIDPRTYEADKNKAEAALAQAQAHLDRLTKDLKRAQELLPTRSIAQGDYDQIAGDHKEAEAAVKTAQATLDLAKLNLAWTKVYAPCDGRVSRQLIDPGNMVQADQTPLTTIVTLDPIYAYFDIDERTLLELRRMVVEQTGKLRPAREAKVKVLLGLADEEGYPHEGMIDFADNRLDMMTGTLRLRGVFPNPKRILSPGMFARIRVPIGEPHRAILIPEEALGSDQGQRFLYVVNDKNEVAYRPRRGRVAARQVAGDQERTGRGRAGRAGRPATDQAGDQGGPAEERRGDKAVLTLRVRSPATYRQLA